MDGVWHMSCHRSLSAKTAICPKKTPVANRWPSSTSAVEQISVASSSFFHKQSAFLRPVRIGQIDANDSLQCVQSTSVVMFGAGCPRRSFSTFLRLSMNDPIDSRRRDSWPPWPRSFFQLPCLLKRPEDLSASRLQAMDHASNFSEGLVDVPHLRNLGASHRADTAVFSHFESKNW